MYRSCIIKGFQKKCDFVCKSGCKVIHRRGAALLKIALPHSSRGGGRAPTPPRRLHTWQECKSLQSRYI